MRKHFWTESTDGGSAGEAEGSKVTCFYWIQVATFIHHLNGHLGYLDLRAKAESVWEIFLGFIRQLLWFHKHYRLGNLKLQMCIVSPTVEMRNASGLCPLIASRGAAFIFILVFSKSQGVIGHKAAESQCQTPKCGHPPSLCLHTVSSVSNVNLSLLLLCSSQIEYDDLNGKCLHRLMYLSI